MAVSLDKQGKVAIIHLNRPPMNSYDRGFMDELITRYYGQMSADARADPNKQCAELGVPYTCGAAEFEAGVDYIRQFAQTRGFSVTSQANALGYVPPAE